MGEKLSRLYIVLMVSVEELKFKIYFENPLQLLLLLLLLLFLLIVKKPFHYFKTIFIALKPLL